MAKAGGDDNDAAKDNENENAIEYSIEKKEASVMKNPNCSSCKISEEKLAEAEQKVEELKSLVLENPNCSSCKISREKLAEAEQKIEELKSYIRTDTQMVDEIEIRMDQKMAQIKGTLGNVSSEVSEIKQILDRIDNSNAETESKLDNLDNLTTQTASKMNSIQGELSKSLHQPSLQTIQKEVKDIGHDVKKVKKTNVEMEVRMRDSVEQTRKIFEQLEKIGKSDSAEVDIIENEPVFKLQYEELPSSEGILLAGDRIIDVMKLRMPDAIFDLFPQSKMVTNRSTRCGEYVTMESYGPMLSELDESTRVLVLSFASDDMLQDPLICTQEKYEWLDSNKREQRNKGVIEGVAQRVSEVLNKITLDFPKLKIIYVIPPPSVREGDAFLMLRNAIKKLPVMQKITQVDVCDVLKGDGWEAVDAEAGMLTWEANRLILKQVYLAIFPDMKAAFCDKCNGIHTEYCPGPNRSEITYTPPKLDKEQCWFCHKFGHRNADCPFKKDLKKRNIYCPHCGASPENLPHQPDWCPYRYTICSLCNQMGHKTDLHKNSVLLKKVHNRLKFNLITSSLKEPTEPSLKRKKKNGQTE